MNRYLLEALILLQGIVLGCVVTALFFRYPNGAADLLQLDFIAAVTIFVLIGYLAVRLEWGARVLYQRRAASIIESRRRLQRSHRALQKLTRSHAINREHSDEGLRELCETAAKTLEVGSVSIWTYDRRSSCFNRIVSYQQEKGFSDLPVNTPAKPSSRYIRELVDNRVVAVVHAANDWRSKKFYSVQVEGATSVLDAPIYLDGELAAVLCHNHYGAVRTWTAEEESFAGSLADLAALVIERQRRKQSELELRRRSLAIETALDGIAILDKDERFVYLNEAYVRIHGYSTADELIGQHWSVLYNQAECVRFRSELMPIVYKNGRLCVESLGLKKNGTLFPQEISVTAIPQGGIICTIRDISARKAAERRVLNSKAFLRTVIDANPHLIFVKNREGRFTLVNQAVADLYGTSVEKLVGKRDADFNPKNDELDKFLTDDLKVIDSREELLIPEEVVTDSQGNEHIFQTIKRPLQDSMTGEVHVLGVATDISQTKQLYQQLVQSQKMEAIGQLAGGIAHDFNNLLTGIIGYADLLRSMNEDPEEVDKAADMISGAASRAAQLTEKLLGFARKGKNQNVPIDIHRSIAESLRLIERTLEKDIMLVEQLGAQSAFVRGDPVQIEQVLLNLVINARDAMSTRKPGTENSKITISTRLMQLDETFQFDGLASGKYLEVSVADTGCGIPEEIRDRIFEPFFTTKERGKGTGMGLAMVYGIVQNHGGAVWVESESGKGTTFHVYLPLCVEQPSIVLKNVPEEAIMGKGAVLIVDDHPIIREVTKEMLEMLGYDVSTVEDGMEAIEFYKRAPEKCGVIILDMVMPRMGARECVHALQAISPHVKVILSTGYGRNEAVQELLNNGIVGFIQKPYQLNKLSEIVAMAMNCPSGSGAARTNGEYVTSH